MVRHGVSKIRKAFRAKDKIDTVTLWLTPQQAVSNSWLKCEAERNRVNCYESYFIALLACL
ncbi:hypothetical protein VCHA29O37_140059 [Vibrio chagasii]|nr:hypothetical protein VCHA29O37_140059 [Vibrio chagasii]